MSKFEDDLVNVDYRTLANLPDHEFSEMWDRLYKRADGSIRRPAPGQIREMALRMVARAQHDAAIEEQYREELRYVGAGVEAINWDAVGAQAVKQFEQNIANAIFAKSERDGGGLAAVITATESVQTPPSAAGDPTHVFRAMRRSRQGLAMYEREP